MSDRQPGLTQLVVLQANEKNRFKGFCRSAQYSQLSSARSCRICVYFILMNKGEFLSFSCSFRLAPDFCFCYAISVYVTSVFAVNSSVCIWHLLMVKKIYAIEKLLILHCFMPLICSNSNALFWNRTRKSMYLKWPKNIQHRFNFTSIDSQKLQIQSKMWIALTVKIL